MGPVFMTAMLAWGAPGELDPPSSTADAPPPEEPPARDEEAAPEGPPLAVPVGQEATAGDARPAPEPSLAVPGRRALSADKARALRRYRREHLAVRGFQEVYVGSTTVSSGWGGWGWGGGWGYGSGWAWTTPYVMRVDGWGVFSGGQRLTVPEALDRLDRTGERVELERRIRRRRTAGTVLYALGGLGLAGSVVGLVGTDQARTFDEARTWSTVATASMLGGASLFVAGSFPLGKARKLEVDPTLTMSRPEAEAWADDANERLQNQLGLTPAEALRLENED